MRYRIMTQSSIYTLDFDAETLTRTPVSGVALRDDLEPVSVLSMKMLSIGEPMYAICIDSNGSVFHRTSTPIVSMYRES